MPEIVLTRAFGGTPRYQTKQAERVRDLEKQVEEFRSLFLTSHNMEQRRQSVSPHPHSARVSLDLRLNPSEGGMCSTDD